MSPGIGPVCGPSVKKERSWRREEGMMKRAMGDWRGGWLTGWLAGIGGSSGDSSSEGKRRRERGGGGGGGEGG